MNDKRILVVDDETDLLEMVKSIFTRAGFTQILTASSGEAALKMCEEQEPDMMISSADVTTKKYPLTLLKILKAATMECLSENPPYSPNFMLPLFSSIYADGQQMVTFTGIVLDSHEKEAKIKEALKNYPHNTFLWDTPSKIEIPALSVREITELNKLLPNPDIRQQLIECFPFIFIRTLNANPDSLGKSKSPDQLQELRLQTLINRVPDSYL